MEIDALFDLVRTVVERELNALPDAQSEPVHWIVIEDERGVATSSVKESEPGRALESFVARGVDGACYVTYVPTPRERVIAYAVTSDPHNSDVRESDVERSNGDAELGDWKYVV